MKKFVLFVLIFVMWDMLFGHLKVIELKAADLSIEVIIALEGNNGHYDGWCNVHPEEAECEK